MNFFEMSFILHTFVQQTPIIMDTKQLQDLSTLLRDASEIITTLAGNLQVAENVIKETGKEKDYSRQSVHWDAEDIVALQLRLHIFHLDTLSEIYQAGRKG